MLHCGVPTLEICLQLYILSVKVLVVNFSKVDAWRLEVLLGALPEYCEIL